MRKKVQCINTSLNTIKLHLKDGFLPMMFHRYYWTNTGRGEQKIKKMIVKHLKVKVKVFFKSSKYN